MDRNLSTTSSLSLRPLPGSIFAGLGFLSSVACALAWPSASFLTAPKIHASFACNSSECVAVKFRQRTLAPAALGASRSTSMYEIWQVAGMPERQGSLANGDASLQSSPLRLASAMLIAFSAECGNKRRRLQRLYLKAPLSILMPQSPHQCCGARRRRFGKAERFITG
jgi:hypothetical protein